MAQTPEMTLNIVDGSKPDTVAPYAYAIRVKGVPTAEGMLALAKKHAPDPSIFDEHPPYFWSVEASNQELDSYSTKMDKTSLRNFAKEATAGVAFLNSHNSWHLPMGYTLTGRYLAAEGETGARMEADAYTIPGLNVSGILTDDLIRGMRSGVIRDVSVGFYLGDDGQYICDLCNNDMMGRDCRHWPGMLYPAAEKEGAPMVRATATIVNAHLSEISAVSDGATPGAGILKAQRAMEAGLLEPEMARALETQYRITLPGSRHVYAISPDAPDEPAPDTEDRMSDTATVTISPPVATAPPVSPEFTRILTRAREVASIQVAEGAVAPTDEFVLERLVEQAARVPALDARILEMEPRARDGEAYRAAMVNETWEEYVRAGLAKTGAEAEKKALWTRQPLDEVLGLQEQFAELATARLGGGRKTTEGEADPNAPRGFVTPSVPSAAFRA